MLLRWFLQEIVISTSESTELGVTLAERAGDLNIRIMVCTPKNGIINGQRKKIELWC